ncbi:hypothetical protein [Luteimonas abyssi]|uniref:hypothetical protein n=1 Tax=Luteimonas abyssi TaxID=1247514 RepID=UPI000737C0AA|nr:hypothetical protein [Luteimonas abyssi]
MHKESIVLAVTMAVAGSAWAASPSAAPLQVGQQVRGEITSADAINYRDGTRSRLYEIRLAPDQGVQFRVDGPLRAHLSLHDEDRLLQSSNDRGDTGTSMSVRVPRAGRYLLAVSGRDTSSYGPYTLNVSPLQLYEGGPVRAGGSITDWSERSRQIPLEIEREGMYAIRMGSDEFDTVLSLDGQGVSLRNDDAEGTNSLITAHLSPGTYTLTAAGYGDTMSGQYTLSVEERALPAGVGPARDGVLTAGETVTALYQGQPATYTLQVPARRLVTIDMRSSDLDSMLALEGEGVALSDDDSGEGVDARIVSVLEPGSYSVRTSSFNDGGGIFTLDARFDDVPDNVGGGSLQIGRSHEAVLMPGVTDRYTVQVRRGGRHLIEMGSTEVDSYVRILRDGVEIGSDDDSGGGLDARLEQTLEPGTYTIEAESAIGGQSGRYRISINRS